MEGQQDERAAAGQRVHLPHLHRGLAAHMILLASLLSSLECMVRREGRPWRGAYYLNSLARQQQQPPDTRCSWLLGIRLCRFRLRRTRFGARKEGESSHAVELGNGGEEEE
jgi:hypothetical protein